MKELKEAYNKGTISKPDYINKMHEIHAHLFEYAEFIKNTDIAKIDITDDSIIMTSRTNDIQLICDKDDKRIIPVEILNFNSYEKENFEMILRLIDDGYNVFDIGGNIGWYSINIAKLKKNVSVFTFEPIPKTFAYLRRNLELNNIKNVQPYNFGFSDQEQDLAFYYYREGSGNASLANLSESDSVEKITCKVKKLDDFILSNKQAIDFIKCDVEGAELFVFKGGIDSMKKHKPVIFAELLRKWAAKFDYQPNEVIRLLRDIGYHCFTVKDGKLSLLFEMDDKTMETNFFFLHNEKHRAKINELTSK
jgi:FkbM family methyltransferase